MIVNQAQSVSIALHRGLHHLKVFGIKQPSRVGDVVVSPNPILTEYIHPTNRVLLSPLRDANPFFHVMETLWMLAGRNDLPWLVRFNKRFSSYSDDGGQTQPGAYGYRWRNYFGHDQIQDAILELRQNPQSRRVVIAMWDGGSRASWWQGERLAEQADRLDEQPGDFYAAVGGSADVPCNTHIYFDTIDGRLNMTVCCRSNDVIWGAYGANAVHFSFLLEYMSIATGLPMGVYRQFSNNFHLYTNVIPELEIMPLARDVLDSDPYYRTKGIHDLTKEPVALRKVPLMVDQETFDAELAKFMEDSTVPHCVDASEFTEPFLAGVAAPMFNAYMYFKDRQLDAAYDLSHLIRADDWRMAAEQWMNRRRIKHGERANQEPFTEVVKVEQDTTFGVDAHGTD